MTGTRITILAVQASDGRWNYGPEGAGLTGILHYEESGPFATAEEALQGARRDPTVPAGADFWVMAPTTAG